MAVTPRTERLLSEIELVRSRGDRSRGKLCIMSLVAYLAEEPHSDHPQCASPMIAAFARPINDAMDRATRQRLRPFAPRINGTTALWDAKRGDLLDAGLTNWLLPTVVRDLQASARSYDQAEGAKLLSELVGEMSHVAKSRHPAFLQNERWDRAALIWPLRTVVVSYRNGNYVEQAEAVARILITTVSRLARPTRRAWYWDRCIALLDELCEVEHPGCVEPVATTDVRPAEPA